MEVVGACFAAKWAWVLGAGAAAAAFPLIRRFVLKQIEKYVGKNLENFIDSSKPEDRELVLALVKWAEKKIPEKGAGTEKYDLVAKKLSSLFPLLKQYEEKVSELIEDAVLKLNEELQKSGTPKLLLKDNAAIDYSVPQLEMMGQGARALMMILAPERWGMPDWASDKDFIRAHTRALRDLQEQYPSRAKPGKKKYRKSSKKNKRLGSPPKAILINWKKATAKKIKGD